MGATTHSLDVNAPLRAVYNQWTQFEEFPRFMDGVVEIHKHGANRLSWKVNIGGKEKQWEAEILEQVPDTRIVWESVDGTQNRGMIAFEPVDFERTRITLTMEYEPEGFLERAGDALGIPSSQVEADLNRFRDFIERREIKNGIGDGPREEVDISGSNGAFGQDEKGLDGVAANGTVTHEDREGSPFSTDTEEILLTTDEGGAKRIDSKVQRSAPSREPATELLPESTSIAASVGPAAEGHSEFYRDAGLLAPKHERIAQLAYELYLERGRVDGYAREDWIEAERQLSISKD
jgi:uncharacterized protein YndB with AHSA1/START domain